MTRILKGVTKLLLFLILLGSLILLYAGLIEPRLLHVVHRSIPAPQLSPGTSPIRLVVFSDTHIRDAWPSSALQKTVDRINREKPDAVLFCGDLFDHLTEYRKTRPDIIDETVALLSSIEAPLGKYAVFGNHDYGGGSERLYPKIMAQSGFQVLINDALDLGQSGIRLIGIDDMLIGRGDPTVARAASADRFNILLAHEPDVAKRITDYPIDLMVAGHTHGRQINLPFFDEYILPPYGRHYPQGEHALGNARQGRLYVTNGLGTTVLPLRFCSVPEILVFTLMP